MWPCSVCQAVFTHESGIENSSSIASRIIFSTVQSTYVTVVFDESTFSFVSRLKSETNRIKTGHCTELLDHGTELSIRFLVCFSKHMWTETDENINVVLIETTLITDY